MRRFGFVVVCATFALSFFPAAAYATCGDGVVDVGEQCDYGIMPSPCCTDACTYDIGHTCRPAAAPCDPAEPCTGISAECPPDVGPGDQDGDGVCDAEDSCPFAADPKQDGKACITKPLGKIGNGEDFLEWQTGQFIFGDPQKIDDGLGPVFNGRSCQQCHFRPMPGGVGSTFVTRFGRYESGLFDPMTSQGGSLVQAMGIENGTCIVAGETVPPEATVSTQRMPTPVFGLGLMETVPDETILAMADPDDADGDGISGRPNMVAGAIGRFGWKAQVATVLAFTGEALRDEIGLTNPLFPDESSPQGGPVVCDAEPDPEVNMTGTVELAAFMRFNAPLKRVPTKGAGHGRSVFRKTGCDACHVGSLRTGENTSRALDRQKVRLFSDLLLHDMGPVLADGIEQGDATGSEFRTAPLWGVGRRGPFLHDGRATTLLDAVLAHGGEAQSVRDAFTELDAADQASLIAFLSSL